MCGRWGKGGVGRIRPWFCGSINLKEDSKIVFFCKKLSKGETLLRVGGGIGGSIGSRLMSDSSLGEHCKRGSLVSL